MTRYSAADRAAIARGEFFTAAELAASPYRRSLAARFAPADTGRPADPNGRPMSAARRREIEALVPVCFWCREPSDERSALNDQGHHPECWEAELEERKVRKARIEGTE